MYRRILVLVDAFSSDLKLAPEKITRAARCLAAGSDSELILLTVMTPRGVGVTVEQFPQLSQRLDAEAKATLKEIASIFADGTKTRVVVLPSGEHSIRQAVARTLEYAKSEKVDCIALSTHARGGLGRFFLGSFAETLLMQSALPTLVVNPSCPWQVPFSRILCPLSTEALKARDWGAVTTLARRLGLPLVVFHQTRPAASVLPTPGFISVDELERQFKEEKQLAEAAVRQCNDEGIATRLEYFCGTEPVAEAIVSAVTRTGSDLVAMSSRTREKGPLMGSLARRVSRESPCPVLVLPETAVD